jgi:hypothetical protein
MIITPYSSLATAIQLPPTTANFPALKHLFTYNEGTLPAGACTFTDSIGGATMGHATGTSTANTDGTVTISTTLGVKGGNAWAVPGTKFALIIQLGKPTSASNSFTMGSMGASAHGYRLTIASSGASAVNNGQAAAVAGTVDATLAGSGIAQANAVLFDFNSATGITQYKFDGTQPQVKIAAAGATTGLGGSGLTAVDASVALAAGMNPALTAVLHFTLQPTDLEIQSAIAWMYYNTLVDSRHNKTIYPGFLGRT